MKCMNFNLAATEEIALELYGNIPVASARELLPNQLSPLSNNNMTPVRLQLARIEKINWLKIPLITVHFDKALWHIGANFNDENGWYVSECDVSHRWIRHLSKLFFSYPLRQSEFMFFEKRKSLITEHQPELGGEMKCHVELGKEQYPGDIIQSFFIQYKNNIRLIRIFEEHPVFCRVSKADVVKDEISQDIFGYPVAWDEECFVFRGRKYYWSEVPQKSIEKASYK